MLHHPDKKRLLPQKGILFGVLVCLLGYCVWTQLRSWQNTRITRTSWGRGGQPRVVEVWVKSTEGRPLPGVKVWAKNNSGGQLATTDAQGYAVMKMGEKDFMGLEANGKRLVNRPLAPVLFYPNVDQGLRIQVQVDDVLALMAQK